MIVNFAHRTLFVKVALLTLLGTGLLQLSARVPAQSPDAGRDGQDTFLDLQSIGLVPGDSLVLTFAGKIDPDPSGTRLGQPITYTYTVNNTSGVVLLERNVEVPVDQFRSIQIGYDELPVVAEPRTGRKQVTVNSRFRTIPLWGVRLHAGATLELVDSTGETRALNGHVKVFDGRSFEIIQ